jgi:hypothetical protein
MARVLIDPKTTAIAVVLRKETKPLQSPILLPFAAASSGLWGKTVGVLSSKESGQ